MHMFKQALAREDFFFRVKMMHTLNIKICQFGLTIQN